MGRAQRESSKSSTSLATALLGQGKLSKSISHRLAWGYFRHEAIARTPVELVKLAAQFFLNLCTTILPTLAIDLIGQQHERTARTTGQRLLMLLSGRTRRAARAANHFRRRTQLLPPGSSRGEAHQHPRPRRWWRSPSTSPAEVGPEESRRVWVVPVPGRTEGSTVGSRLGKAVAAQGAARAAKSRPE